MINLWTPNVLKIYRALNGQMRLVGGCVRDFLLGKEPDDIDMATPLLPDAVRDRLSSAGVKSHLIAPRHGLTEILLDGEKFEITTLRRDSYEGGKQQVTFITDYEQDAIRRDFTINALSMDKDKIYDYFGGESDLKMHQVRFIGDSEKRIMEDPLRIFRYIRFWAAFGGDNPDSDVLALFPKYRGHLTDVSLTRRKKEFLKIIMGPRPLAALDIMRAGGLFPYIVSRDGLNHLQKLLSLKPNASKTERLLCFNNFIQN
ncbi:MAG: CCA tRNA nucleotidyltransferase [Alphaproteobacteria bacterium]|nr:CCA tRNA nucleotidyltransferase [Alphaproteobacteria bacterium]